MLEFFNNLWGLGTEKEWGCRTGPPGYTVWRNWFLGIDSCTLKVSKYGLYCKTKRFWKPRDLFRICNHEVKSSVFVLKPRYHVVLRGKTMLLPNVPKNLHFRKTSAIHNTRRTAAVRKFNWTLRYQTCHILPPLVRYRKFTCRVCEEQTEWSGHKIKNRRTVRFNHYC